MPPHLYQDWPFKMQCVYERVSGESSLIFLMRIRPIKDTLWDGGWKFMW